MIDYATLRVIWWAILGVLLIGFAIMDGMDLGVAILHPFVAKNDTQRRVSINTIAPVWEGNQVWFILGGGAAFAAWPLLYSVSFSGFYLAMLLVLLGLILRPVSMTFRGKLLSLGWRRSWDWLFFISGLFPSLLFGVAFGNLLLGTPFHLTQAMQGYYEGGLIGLLHPFALLCGLVSVAMMIMQGGAWLGYKCDGDVSLRARFIAAVAALILILLFSLAGLCVASTIDGYRLVYEPDTSGPSNPLFKVVISETGAWLANYQNYKWSIAAPCLAFAGALLAAVLLSRRASKLALFSSSLSVAGVVATAGFSMFPFLMPSSTHPNHSLTIWDSSSSTQTLGIMLVAVVFFLPIILAYTSWVYHVLRGPVTEHAIEQGEDYFY